MLFLECATSFHSELFHLVYETDIVRSHSVFLVLSVSNPSRPILKFRRQHNSRHLETRSLKGPLILRTAGIRTWQSRWDWVLAFYRLLCTRHYHDGSHAANLWETIPPPHQQNHWGCNDPVFHFGNGTRCRYHGNPLLPHSYNLMDKHRILYYIRHSLFSNDFIPSKEQCS